MPDFAALFARRKASAEERYQAALAALAAEEKGQYAEYGFASEGDGKFRMDPNLQYGRARTLMRSQAGELAAQREQQQATGIRKGGLAAQREALLRFKMGGETAELGSAFARALGQIAAKRQGSLHDRNSAFSDIDYDELMNQLQMQSFDGGAPGWVDQGFSGAADQNQVSSPYGYPDPPMNPAISNGLGRWGSTARASLVRNQSWQRQATRAAQTGLAWQRAAATGSQITGGSRSPFLGGDPARSTGYVRNPYATSQQLVQNRAGFRIVNPYQYTGRGQRG